ncbi:MAG TPA: tetratricopeptide repeat protein [Burkholderiales bacterium]|nr:tetratricopeptide repeat protein [Burkholderiales bacterium]
MSAAVTRKLELAHRQLRGGDADAAASACEDVLKRAPRNPEALWLLGTAHLMRDRADEAVTLFERALAAQPDNGAVLEHLGLAHLMRNDFVAAERALRKAVAIPGAPASVSMRLGHALLRLARPAEAARAFERALAQDPHVIEAHSGLARAYAALGRWPQAARELELVLAETPNDGETLFYLARVRFEQAQFDAAFDAASRAREVEPLQIGPYALLAQMHHVRGELDRAVAVLEEGYERTRADALVGMLTHVAHRQCDWTKWRTAWQHMSARLEHSADLGSPFWLLHEDTTPEQQLSYTRRWVERAYPASPVPPAPVRSTRSGERLRIGYYSGDFHQHPVACLVVEALELHDRQRFEIFAYSYGPDDKSAMRTRIAEGVEHFVDVAWDPNDVVAGRIRGDQLDLLIDLKGYTAGDRLAVMAQRPCTRQAAWLGYPGTTGAQYIDYLIADDVLIPRGAEQSYSERVVRLPHVYQPNDRKRRSSEPRSRAEYGLAEGSFVFCCFNQSVKVTPEVFARWMALLRSVPHAVLWLLEDNPQATENLLAAAHAAGIARERVVIAPRLAPADHLARYRVADLALDTFPYTSHTTGSDALWLGCPLVALCGKTFAARVSTSLLRACGLPELVTHTFDDYEKLAYRLATDAALLAAIRMKLAAARDTAPLFDSRAFTRSLESLYVELTHGPAE